MFCGSCFTIVFLLEPKKDDWLVYFYDSIFSTRVFSNMWVCWESVPSHAQCWEPWSPYANIEIFNHHVPFLRTPTPHTNVGHRYPQCNYWECLPPLANAQYQDPRVPKLRIKTSACQCLKSRLPRAKDENPNPLHAYTENQDLTAYNQDPACQWWESKPPHANAGNQACQCL